MAPWAIPFTVMPSGPSSIASVRVSILTPPLLAQYEAKPGNGSSSWTELMLMALPGLSVARRCRTNAWVVKNSTLARSTQAQEFGL